jgi:glycosyltransferase involved in cell wall biosynthesis
VVEVRNSAVGEHRHRVAVVYHFFPHYRSAIVEALARSRVADFVFIGDVHEYLGSVAPAVLSGSVRFERAPARHLFGTWMWQWGAVRAALDRRFDTVIFHAVPHWPCTWIGAVLARLAGKRVLFWGHGFLYPPTGLKGAVRRAFYALPHVHLVYGRLAKSIAMDLGWRPADVHVVYNSLDNEAQRRIRASISDEEALAVRASLFGDVETPVIACPSRLITARGLSLLFDAVAILGKRGVRANVLLVGDGPERRALEARAALLGVRCHFEGETYDEERIARLMRASNVTAAPGKVGLTALHSMTYGVPVVTHGDVAHQMPEWETVIPGKTGSLFERGSADSLADAIVPWLATRLPSEATRTHCHRMADWLWSPGHQRAIIERAVLRQPASDIPVAAGR